jgi:hypothetical protein
MPPGQPAFRSPGTLRSRCLDHRQLGQWLRCDVPGASSETSTPQCPHWNERGNDKSDDLSQLCLEAGQTSRLLSYAAGDPAGRANRRRPLSSGAASHPSTRYPRRKDAGKIVRAAVEGSWRLTTNLRQPLLWANTTWRPVTALAVQMRGVLHVNDAAGRIAGLSISWGRRRARQPANRGGGLHFREDRQRARVEHPGQAQVSSRVEAFATAHWLRPFDPA